MTIILRLDNNNKYSNYLPIQANYLNHSGLCGGKYAAFLKNNFDLRQLPYNIKLLDLIIASPSCYELYIDLPSEIFENWENYPCLTGGANMPNPELCVAFSYDFEFAEVKSTEVQDFLHPYDLELKESFVQKYKVTKKINSIAKLQHANGRFFYSCEVYLAHWRSYILIDTIVDCKFIENYLLCAEGTKRFKQKFVEKNEYWNQHYKKNLDIVSTYRSVITRAGNQVVDKVFFAKLLNILDINEKNIEEVIEDLLIIYQNFKSKKDRNKLTDLNGALNLLQQDIYFMVEWLEILGVERSRMYEKWSYPSRVPKRWAQLIDVLPRKEVVDKIDLLRYSRYYLEQEIFEKWLSTNNLEIKDTVEILLTLETSEVWIRKFCELHREIQSTKESIRFDYPLIVDSLLVLTIRTESILKERLEQLSGNSINLLKDVFKKLADYGNEKNKRVLQNVQTLLSKDNELTRLEKKPEDILDKIRSLDMSKNLNNCDKHFLKSILTFITLRNYFAHHYYKDNELNYITSVLGKEVIKACLTTIIFSLGATKQVPQSE